MRTSSLLKLLIKLCLHRLLSAVCVCVYVCNVHMEKRLERKHRKSLKSSRFFLVEPSVWFVTLGYGFRFATQLFLLQLVVWMLMTCYTWMQFSVTQNINLMMSIAFFPFNRIRRNILHTLFDSMEQ